MINLYLKILIVCLLSTIIVEVIVSLLLKVRDKKDILNIILVNIMTNPLLVSITVYINIFYGLKYKNIIIYPLEILVVLVEGLVYKRYIKYKKINPYLLSFILNISSYLIGLFINIIIY
jgi:hypothetical protein